MFPDGTNISPGGNMEKSTQNINLWNTDKKIVKSYAEEKGISISAAMTIIIREWYKSKQKGHKEAAPKA